VLRQGRITPAQAQALERLWPRYGVEFNGAALDLGALFGRPAPVVLEIGFGNGEQLAYAGAHEATRNHLGIEVHRPGVGRVLNRLDQAGTSNVRVLAHDAVEVLEDGIAPRALAEVRIYFPDPWPKARHHKRRLVQAPFVALLASRLQPGGRLHLATDWQEYAQHMREVLAASPDFLPASPGGPEIARPDWRAETHFERRGLRLGHVVSDLLYVRR